MCDQKCEPKPFECVDLCAFLYSDKKWLIRQTKVDKVNYFFEKKDCQNRIYWHDMGELTNPTTTFLLAILNAMKPTKE